MAQAQIGQPFSIAQNVVHKTLKLGDSDIVEIETSPHTIELARQIALEARRAGADTRTTLFDEDLWLESIKTLPLDWLRESSKFHEAVINVCTAAISVAGTSDPTKLRSVPPERWAANSEGGQKVGEITEARKLRTVSLLHSLATPARAKTYGIDLNQWQRVLNDATATDLNEVSKKGRQIADLLSSANSVQIKAPNGTDLRFEIGDRPVKINDGIIDEEDIAEGSHDVSLPTGRVNLTVHEDSGEGQIKFDRPLPYKGSLIEGTSITFQNGKLASFASEKNHQLVQADYDAATGDKDRIASLSIGINPKTEYGYILDPIVSGAVTIGIGSNHVDGGKNHATFGNEWTLSTATLSLDGRTIIQNGRLQV